MAGTDRRHVAAGTTTRNMTHDGVTRMNCRIVSRTHVVLTLALLLAASGAALAADKIVIAHRGASGYVPEHTLEAYALAYGLGADYIEQDLVFTKDGHFICLHDIHLEATTNVEEVFPDRKRDDGRWYAADFTLDEVKQLRAHERIPKRFPIGASKFEVPTFEEAIELIQGLNKTTGRDVGIYPELKEPSWHRKAGLPMEEAFLEIVTRYGYKGKEARIFVQCFEAGPLKTMRRDLKSELPQILLIGNDRGTDALTSDDGLKAVAEYADGLGPDKMRVERDPDMVQRAHAHHLLVHPYTVRADSLPSKYATMEDELERLYVVCDVDGLFTDFSDRAVKFLEAKGLRASLRGLNGSTR